MNERFRPVSDYASRTDLHDAEDREVEYIDKTRWEIEKETIKKSWDVLFPMDETDIENLERYAG